MYAHVSMLYVHSCVGVCTEAKRRPCMPSVTLYLIPLSQSLTLKLNSSHPPVSAFQGCGLTGPARPHPACYIVAEIQIQVLMIVQQALLISERYVLLFFEGLCFFM